MAEGFANHYGSDVLRASSAGLAPIRAIPRETVLAMDEKGVDVSKHMPRLYFPQEAAICDLVVNMAGLRLPGIPPKNLVEWNVPDPYRDTVEVYKATRDEIEQQVVNLILGFRKMQKAHSRAR